MPLSTLVVLTMLLGLAHNASGLRLTGEVGDARPKGLFGRILGHGKQGQGQNLPDDENLPDQAERHLPEGEQRVLDAEDSFPEGRFPEGRFVVMTQPHSGGGSVMRMLNAHAGIYAGDLEFASRGACGVHLPGATDVAINQCDPAKMKDVLNEWYGGKPDWYQHGRFLSKFGAANVTGRKTRGFKVRVSEGLLNTKFLPKYLAAHGVRVVFLWRRNVLRHLAEAGAGGPLPEGSGTRLDAKGLLGALRKSVGEQKQAEQLLAVLPESRRLTVYLEDLEGAETSVESWKTLTSFLNVRMASPKMLSSEFTPVRDVPLERLLNNAEHVGTILKGSEFEHMLHE